MYRSVAEDPHGDFHFEMGRAMAERLGYAAIDLDRVPAEAIQSFAGVGTTSIWPTSSRVRSSWTSAAAGEWTPSSQP